MPPGGCGLAPRAPGDGDSSPPPTAAARPEEAAPLPTEAAAATLGADLIPWALEEPPMPAEEAEEERTAIGADSSSLFATAAVLVLGRSSDGAPGKATPGPEDRARDSLPDVTWTLGTLRCTATPAAAGATPAGVCGPAKARPLGSCPDPVLVRVGLTGTNSWAWGMAWREQVSGCGG